LHPPETRLVQIRREGKELRISGAGTAPRNYALLGVRACELAAIRIQDRVLLEDRYRDPVYAARRQGVFIIAVQCTQAASNCFCTSMNTGPKAESGFDLALTELINEEGHYFVAEAGSEKGTEVLAELKPPKALAKAVKQAEAAVEATAKAITKRVDTAGLKELLYQSFEHSEWDNVAKRCLNCGNCTLACPTCFCITVEDGSDVALTTAERWRRWDSCFVQNFSYIHGGAVRMSPKSRYRQWLTHKLGSWVDQFGTFGCVGCGRCITWCPVGIDITEEVAIMRGGLTAAAGGQDDAKESA
jgi:ferredoxin